METGSQNERASITERVSFLRRDGAGFAVLSVLGFYAAAVLLTVLAVAAVSEFAQTHSGGTVDLFAVGTASVAALAVLSAAMAASGLSKPGEGGWAVARSGLPWFARGLWIGVAMAVVVVGTGVVFGGATFSVASPRAYVTGAAAVSAGLLPAALNEEMLFRGFPLSRLSSVFGRVRASLALAVVFTVLHAGNPEVTAFGLVNIGLASLVLSAAFFTSGRIWMAWGLHFGWNWGLMMSDAPVSGIGFNLPGVQYDSGNAAWLTGGAFGPEGGVAASVVLIGTVVLMYRRLVAGAENEEIKSD